MIVDLFAGPGGWDEGLSMVGRDDVIGMEIDEDACKTASAAGHVRWMLDVLDLDPQDFDNVNGRLFDLEGLVASPPCPAFSQGGEGHGRKEDVRRSMLDFIYACGDAGKWIDPPSYYCDEDIRADLTLQPLRWALTARPKWMAFEQVPVVETHWYAMAEVLRQFGYDASTRVLNFANYGLPQFRERAILLASLDDEIVWPAPTHQDLRHHDSLFDNLEPWTSVADALKVKGGDPILQRPAATVTGGGGKDNGTGIFLDKRFRNALRAALNRPTGGVLRPWEAGVLQGFPTAYPWRGYLASQYMQIGNAMPPTMAALLLGQFVR